VKVALPTVPVTVTVPRPRLRLAVNVGLMVAPAVIVVAVGLTPSEPSVEVSASGTFAPFVVRFPFWSSSVTLPVYESKLPRLPCNAQVFVCVPRFPLQVADVPLLRLAKPRKAGLPAVMLKEFAFDGAAMDVAEAVSL
jgi:hypothetical protein